jgi:hypothetical protein
MLFAGIGKYASQLCKSSHVGAHQYKGSAAAAIHRFDRSGTAMCGGWMGQESTTRDAGHVACGSIFLPRIDNDKGLSPASPAEGQSTVHRCDLD